VVLSVIIVNYRVKYFLEQCLCSVQKAIRTTDKARKDFGAEIFVVDNDSGDGALQYLQPKFPEVQFIDNPSNEGFSKANNRALARSTGKYILFLNPDTLLGEDSLEESISFLQTNERAGALGVRMIDGSGQFLKESKRAFPGPWVAFCKLSGLAAVFPHSRWFARYYLGHLDPLSTSPVDVLSGAFILVKKEVLDQTGGFDERFFMYAEDIDLCYRIKQAGFCNYYFAGTTVVHFKGESATKNAGQTRQFYKAMNQFVSKHFRHGWSQIFVPFLKGAVWLSSQLAQLTGLLSKKNKPHPQKAHMAFLVGDLRRVEEMKNLLLQNNRLWAAIPEQADEIIFCEGLDLSYHQIIENMQQARSPVSYWIHGQNSNSLVGSDSKNKQGVTLHW
jgi:N-acetylglucosaminyl-diphospho-decaprenol L-rhamnosyltransferase